MTTDRRVDPQKRDRLSQIAEGYEERNRRTTFYLRVFVVLFGVAAVVFTFQQVKLGDQADKTRTLAEANQRLGIQIQIERARSVRDTCEGQNNRHDNTIMVLDQQLAQIYLQENRKHADPDKVDALIKRSKASKTNQDARQVVLDAEKLLGKKVAAEMEAGRAPNAFLIDALAPVRDCDKVVRDAVHRTG